MLGIGRSGHIGFNEPGSFSDTRTRLIHLDEMTRKDAASDFFGEENVPLEALTMGVGTILDAKRIILMATGEHKAHIIQRSVEGKVSPQEVASYLQNHRDATIYVDPASAGQLTRVSTHWLMDQSIEWTPRLIPRAVLWLCEQTQKPVLHLLRRDYSECNLHTLIDTVNSVDDLNKRTFDDVRLKIREKQDLFTNTRCLCFSPHPDDDVISMGGTQRRLSETGNDLTVAYMTNGNIAVFDKDTSNISP